MTTATRRQKVNSIGLEFTDYKGQPTTLCQGCGHNSIANQIVQVAYELNLRPNEIIKLSGIGCSSKSPAYFLGMSHGFNGLHGRMPSIGTGALMANHHLKAIGVSGDGDTGSIGMGQFKHLCRRNVRMVYIVENNGVYGLTKGQFSATADEGQELKYAGRNEFPPVDVCQEAIIAGCGFVARSFSGDSNQVRELLKAALSHRGTAVLDIISPCVAFNNHDTSTKSYSYGKEHESPLHEIGFVPIRDEIMIDEYAPGEMKVVELHDGSVVQLRKLEADYDPTSRAAALSRLEQAAHNQEFITGLIYFNDERPSLAELNNLPDVPLVNLPVQKLRPSPEQLGTLLDKFM
ncbi:MAG: 2-oxoacid:ferredoxin oxidoreductase subunit beta [Ardenticatenaceae bacterium]|nr:2-oxoacid:ferredoxin oxidoreductase subunit beta [Anaerolineales bacterium]MCB8917377.1 2-oxoacid:ferredoxin oxidoreductase subunit beta [Ardenticatenaceae bacterium]